MLLEVDRVDDHFEDDREKLKAVFNVDHVRSTCIRNHVQARLK